MTVPEGLTEHSGRQMNAEYQEKLLMKVVMRFGGKLLIPAPVRAVWTGVRSLKYLQQGIASLKKGRLEVAALDATAIGVSILRRDMNTASSIMFLLGIGELLEEWTHKNLSEICTRHVPECGESLAFKRGTGDSCSRKTD